MTQLDLAIELEHRGYCVVPTHNKQPRTTDWVSAPSLHTDERRRLLYGYASQDNAGAWRPGVVCGDVVVIDVDDFRTQREVRELIGGACLDLWQAVTPRGCHYPFRDDGSMGVIGCRVGVMPHVDVRGRGGLAVVYNKLWPRLEDLPSVKFAAPILNRLRVMEMARPRRAAAQDPEYALELGATKVRLAPEGGRNHRLYRETVSLMERGDLLETLVAGAMRAAALEAGLEEEEVEVTIASAAMKAEKNKKSGAPGR